MVGRCGRVVEVEMCGRKLDDGMLRLDIQLGVLLNGRMKSDSLGSMVTNCSEPGMVIKVAFLEFNAMASFRMRFERSSWWKESERLPRRSLDHVELPLKSIAKPHPFVTDKDKKRMISATWKFIPLFHCLQVAVLQPFEFALESFQPFGSHKVTLSTLHSSLSKLFYV